MKVLAIGNSFSQDAARYLHDIAKADGVDMKVVNLYIGGCSLRRHYINILNDERAYSMEFNGCPTGFSVSVREALQSDEWDAVTMQQVSSLSTDYETYQPYLTALSEYVSLHAPKAKQLIHQTWAYEEGSKRLCEELGYTHQEEMFADIKAAYETAAQSIKAHGIIPCGAAFQNLIAHGAGQIHRDTYHASLGLGRYTLGLVWYEALTGRECADNGFADFDEPLTKSQIKMAKQSAHRAVKDSGGCVML